MRRRNMATKSDRSRRRRASTDFVERCIAVLKESGARITKPRLAMLQCLAEAERALSPRAIMERVLDAKGLPVIDLATVYRCLEALTDLGLIHRISPNGDFVACEHLGCTADLHVLVHCLSCDITHEFDLPDTVGTSLKRCINKSARFSPDEHLVVVNGKCKECNRG